MQIRDRIKNFRRVKARELLPHPRNWRTHSREQQDAMRGVLAEIGYADALLARELPDGSLQLVDGHLRAEVAADALVPVLVLDVSEDEALKLLATLDPLAAMAGADAELLDRLVSDVQTENTALQNVLSDLTRTASGASADQEIQLLPLGIQTPPEMSWVLVGIPTVRFAEIADQVEQFASIEGIILETTANDGPKD